MSFKSNLLHITRLTHGKIESIATNKHVARLHAFNIVNGNY